MSVCSSAVIYFMFTIHNNSSHASVTVMLFHIRVRVLESKVELVIRNMDLL